MLENILLGVIIVWLVLEILEVLVIIRFIWQVDRLTKRIEKLES